MKKIFKSWMLILLVIVEQKLCGAPLVLPETLSAKFPDVALLYESGAEESQVFILDMRDVQRVETRGSISVMVNLAPRLMIAGQVQITRVDHNQRVRVRAERCLMDSFPCFQSNKGFELDGLHTNTTWSVDFLPSDIIRINGCTMSLLAASEIFSLIPPNSVLTEPQAGPPPVRDGVQTPSQGTADAQSQAQILQSYENYRFLYERAIRLREWKTAEKAFLGVLQLIPDEDDERHVEAKRLLKGVAR